MKASYWGSFSTHAWVGTQECLRDRDRSCVNDRTGCLYNDGHNKCNHAAPSSFNPSGYDSPLRRRRS